jgi:hypothetical protein
MDLHESKILNYLIPRSKTVALAGFAGMVVGAFLPWAKFLFLSKEGIEGDGVLTLILGFVGFGLVAVTSGKGAAVSALLAILGFIIAVYDVIDVRTTPVGEGILNARPSVGIGLWLTLAASVAAAVGSSLRWVQIRSSSLEMQPPPEQPKASGSVGLGF